MKPKTSRNSFFLLTGLLALMAWSCDDKVDLPEEDTVPNDAAYAVGDTGPGGGIVFLDKGDSTNGWRYIEISMADLGQAEWGCFNTPVTEARNSGVGTGGKNTDEIISFHDALQSYYTNPGNCSNESDGTVAAKIVADYTANGLDDWHLPSSQEMLRAYQNLEVAGLASFDTEFLYWTSTEVNDNTAVAIDFANGDSGLLCKQCSEVVTVRAVRYFK